MVKTTVGKQLSRTGFEGFIHRSKISITTALDVRIMHSRQPKQPKLRGPQRADILDQQPFIGGWEGALSAREQSGRRVTCHVRCVLASGRVRVGRTQEIQTRLVPMSGFTV